MDELSLREFNQIFEGIGDYPYWFTISGGEPFFRDDLVGICQSIYRNCQPKIINIPTNGILWETIPQKVEKIVKTCPRTQFIINVSLDDIEERHDEIRRVKGNFEKVLETYRALKAMDYPNLAVGIHTVISKFNVKRIPSVYQYVANLEPDSYVTEIAEQRAELNTIRANITPELKDYEQAIDHIIKGIKKWRFKGISRITQAFRFQYYGLVKKTLTEKRQIIPCYAGFASCQIAPDGNVWFCCIKAESIGNLRDNGYDFRRLWFNEKAHTMRKALKEGRCYCPLANVSYTNMLFDPSTLFKVGMRVIDSLNFS